MADDCAEIAAAMAPATSSSGTGVPLRATTTWLRPASLRQSTPLRRAASEMRETEISERTPGAGAFATTTCGGARIVEEVAERDGGARHGDGGTELGRTGGAGKARDGGNRGEEGGGTRVHEFHRLLNVRGYGHHLVRRRE